MLDLLKTVAKQLTPEVLAEYLGTMLEATKVCESPFVEEG